MSSPGAPSAMKKNSSKEIAQACHPGARAIASRTGAYEGRSRTRPASRPPPELQLPEAEEVAQRGQEGCPADRAKATSSSGRPGQPAGQRLGHVAHEKGRPPPAPPPPPADHPEHARSGPDRRLRPHRRRAPTGRYIASTTTMSCTIRGSPAPPGRAGCRSRACRDSSLTMIDRAGKRQRGWRHRAPAPGAMPTRQGDREADHRGEDDLSQPGDQRGRPQRAHQLESSKKTLQPDQESAAPRSPRRPAGSIGSSDLANPQPGRAGQDAHGDERHHQRLAQGENRSAPPRRQGSGGPDTS